jgi:hypothetical protein
MTINPALLSSLAALCGALVGGSTSFVSTVYSQRLLARRERVARELIKREAVYAEFILAATAVMAKAVISDIALGAEEQRLFGLANRIRLFAPPKVIEEAEKLVRLIIEVSLKPRVDLRAAAGEALAARANPLQNPLLPLSRACQEDLESLERAVTWQRQRFLRYREALE